MQCTCLQCKSSLTDQDRKAFMDRSESDLEEVWKYHQDHIPGDDNDGFLRELQHTMVLLPNIRPEDLGAQMPAILQRLIALTDPVVCSKVRVTDFEYLRQHCRPLLDTCAAAFEGRTQNRLWWQRTVIFFCDLSAMLSPTQMETFFYQKWLNNLITSLTDLLSAPTDPLQRTAIMQVTAHVLLILANAVDSNPKIAAKIQTLGIGSALFALASSSTEYPFLSGWIARFTSSYIKKLTKSNPAQDADFFLMLGLILRQSYNQHYQAINTLLACMVQVFVLCKDQPETKNFLLLAIHDTLTNFGLVFRGELTDCFVVTLFNLTPIASYLCSTFPSNELVVNLMQHPHWDVISALFLQQTNRWCKYPKAAELTADLCSMWQEVLYRMQGRVKLQLCTIQLAFQLSNSNDDWHFSNRLLNYQFCQSSIEELHFLIKCIKVFFYNSEKLKTDFSIQNRYHRTIKKIKDGISWRTKNPETVYDGLRFNLEGPEPEPPLAQQKLFEYLRLAYQQQLETEDKKSKAN